MKILCIYLLIINFIMFISNASDKENNMALQIILYFIPTVTLLLLILTRA